MDAHNLNGSEDGSHADPLRNGVRFPLHLKVRVEAAENFFDAETEDVSASGVQFRMADAPEVNARVAWTMILPAEVMGSVADTVVHCIGRVVWKHAVQGMQQVGVMIDSYRIAGGSN